MTSNKEHRDLMITFGKLEDNSVQWDISFWQSVDTNERFRATSELIRIASDLKEEDSHKLIVDRKYIQVGTYSDD